MKIKYLFRRTRADGQTIWAINPPKHVRETIGAAYQQFDSREDAAKYSIEVSEAYSDYKRGIHRKLKVNQDTVDGLIAFYKSTSEWKKLSYNSKIHYDLVINTARRMRIGTANINFTEMMVKNVSPTHADKLYQTISGEISKHRAAHTCKVLRKVWYVGKRHGLVQFNPFERMGLKGLEDRVVLWEADQVATFISTADAMNMRSIGTLALLCYDLCQRPGDMRQLRWEQYKEGVFTFAQEKTNTEVSIPASPRLQERLREVYSMGGSSHEEIVVCEATQRPYDRRLYAKWAAKVRLEAKLPSTLQLRDLRRTGATEMAEAGCTEDELRSVTGHQSRDVLSIYVRPTKKLAIAGINKRFQQHG